MGCIFVTGAAGFIGHRVTQQLAAEGHQVVAIDSLNDAYDVAMKRHRLSVIEKLEGVSFRKIDIENLASIQDLFREFPIEAVINLAARAGVRYSIENPHVYLTTNAHGALNLLEAMREAGCERLIQASTSSLYAGQPMPFRESSQVDKPLSPYAASKKAAETMAYTYHHLYGIHATVLRYFTVYGPAGRPDMAPFRFIRWIDEGTPLTVFGDGSQTRDFTYVDDIARGTIAALGLDGHHTINLGGGKKPIALLDFIRAIEERLGKTAEIRWEEMSASEMIDTSADIAEAKRLLDWEPHTDLDAGLDRTVEWYLANKDWASRIAL